jgi:hypothetical protein
MRKIGALYPLWNQELFIKPHLEMLKGIDRIVVLMQGGPLPNYHLEHGYSNKPDLTREIITTNFPNVEIYESNYPWMSQDFSADLYNEGLRIMQDCDIVLRLDPDMFFLKEDWAEFVDFIRNTNFDCYRIDFRKNSVNYYMTGVFDRGLKDAQEIDPLGVSPRHMFTGILDYPLENTVVYKERNRKFAFHHFRGWNKPKSTPIGWDKQIGEEYFDMYSDKGKWFSCPEPIKTDIQNWLDELYQLKGERAVSKILKMEEI